MIVKMNISEHELKEWKYYDLNSGDLTTYPIGKLRINGKDTGKDVHAAECLLVDIELCLERSFAVQIAEAVGVEVLYE